MLALKNRSMPTQLEMKNQHKRRTNNGPGIAFVAQWGKIHWPEAFFPEAAAPEIYIYIYYVVDVIFFSCLPNWPRRNAILLNSTELISLWRVFLIMGPFTSQWTHDLFLIHSYTRAVLITKKKNIYISGIVENNCWLVRKLMILNWKQLYNVKVFHFLAGLICNVRLSLWGRILTNIIYIYI